MQWTCRLRHWLHCWSFSRYVRLHWYKFVRVENLFHRENRLTFITSIEIRHVQIQYSLFPCTKYRTHEKCFVNSWIIDGMGIFVRLARTISFVGEWTLTALQSGTNQMHARLCVCLCCFEMVSSLKTNIDSIIFLILGCVSYN